MNKFAIKRRSRSRKLIQKLERQNFRWIMIGLAAIVLLAAVNIAVSDDVDHYLKEYSDWAELTLNTKYLVADNFLQDLQAITSSPQNGTYGVAYRGTASLNACAELYDVCVGSEADVIVIAKEVLPNGIHTWLTMTPEDLQAMAERVDHYELNSGDLICTTQLFTYDVNCGWRANIHAFLLRSAQDWMLLTHRGFFAWEMTICLVSGLLFGILEIYIISSYWRRERRITRHRDIVEKIDAEEQASYTVIVQAEGAKFEQIDPPSKLPETPAHPSSKPPQPPSSAPTKT